MVCVQCIQMHVMLILVVCRLQLTHLVVRITAFFFTCQYMHTNPAPKRPLGMVLGVIDKWLALRLAQAVLARREVTGEDSISLFNAQQKVLKM